MNFAAVATPRIESKAAVFADKNIRLLPMYPFGVVYGGVELQCLKSRDALQTAGVKAPLLDYYDPESRPDLLHLFGSSCNYYDICRGLGERTSLVVSAVCAARSASRLRAAIWNAGSRAAHCVRMQTTHERMGFVFRRAAAVLCLNRLEAEFVHVTYGVSRSCLEVVHCGVDERYFSAAPDIFVERFGVEDFVLFTGNIVERKGPLMLAQALRDLGLPGVFVGGTLAAESSYAERFAQLIAESPRLMWIQRLDHRDPLLPSACAAARVFCLPSSAETQSASALEAMASGTPLILGDFPYAYQEPFQRSLKCNPRSAASIRDAVERAYRSPAEYAVQLDDSFRWRAIGEQLASVYARVLRDAS